jgi:hypothetical protein
MVRRLHFFIVGNEPIDSSKRKVCMSRTLHPLIAVTAALILAFPPGFCSVVLTSRSVSVANPVADSTSPSSRCCHSCPTKEQPVSRQLPADSGWRCCCAVDPRLPHKPVPPPEAWIATVPTFIDGSMIAPSIRNADRPEPLPSGPRRHVLLCVWRC